MLFSEDIELFPKEDDPSAHFDAEKLEIKYFLPHIYSDEELNHAIVHEWLHGLFMWADEEEWSEEGDHFIMKQLGYGE